MGFLVHQGHDLVFEFVPVILRRPFDAHVLYQALGHVEFALGQLGLGHIRS
ncbi:hypothetical protein D3C78_1845930 [compost metagenome]